MGRRPVLLIGDGAAQLTVQELGTFSREGLSPVIVVVDNDGYTVERIVSRKRQSPTTTLSAKMGRASPTHWACHRLTFRARTYGELDDAFVAAAQNQDRIVLIEAIAPRLDVPDLLNELAQPTSPDGSPASVNAQQ